MLADVDSQLHSAYNKAGSKEEYFLLTSQIPTSYVYQIGDIQSLQVVLTFLYPDTPDGEMYRLDTYRVVTDDDLDYDNSLHLIQIEDIE
jgi:hypothetical protein